MISLLRQDENNVDLAYALKISVDAKPCQEAILLEYSDPPAEDFGRRLKRLAKERGYTNRALAKLTGAHEVTVSRWMSGSEPGVDTLLTLAELLDVSLEVLRKGAKPAKQLKQRPRSKPQPHGARKREKGSGG